MELNPYAKYLGGQEPIPVITATIERLHALVDPLSLSHVNRNPAPGKWSIAAIVAHLADCELVFSFRLRQTLAEEHPIIQPFDQEKWAERYAAYDLAAALALFSAARYWNVKLLTTVNETDRQQPGYVTYISTVQRAIGQAKTPRASRPQSMIAQKEAEEQ